MLFLRITLSLDQISHLFTDKWLASNLTIDLGHDSRVILA